MQLSQNRRQKVINRGTLRSCRGLHIQIWQKFNEFIVFHVSIWGDLELRLGRLSPPKAPVATRLNCAPYLFDSKLRLIKLFHHFMRLAIKVELHFLFFCFIERYRWRSVFPWLRFVDQILISHLIYFNITCTSVTAGIMINRRQL